MKYGKWLGLCALSLLLSTGCDKKEAAPTEEASPAAEATDEGKADEKAAPAIQVDKGVDLETKTIKIGALNVESGPAAVLGKPYALGKRLLAEQINAGGVLPDGWKVEMVERDHGYNPAKSVQYYNDLKDEVLFIATSFGTPTTIPLRASQERDKMVAFPASLSSKMAEFAYTPPLGSSYVLEAKRGMDWAIESAGGAANVKAAVVYQQDDYGKDGLQGWKEQAKARGVTVVSEQAVARGQKDFSAIITSLKDAGATHILLCVLPSATGPILGTAAKLQYMPTWIGSTPAWIDAFFIPQVIPAVVFTNFYWLNSMVYWGEPSEAMTRFTEVFKKFGGDAKPDFYVLMSYVQGLVYAEAINKAIANNDLTRDGFLKALQSIKDFDAGGFGTSLSLDTFPYASGKKARVLKPDMGNKTWTEAAPMAEPKS